MSDSVSTTVSQLTPTGRGAIAVVSVCGPCAMRLVEQYFHPAGQRPLSSVPLRRIVFGRWDSDAGEEVVVCRLGDDRVEIHGHGGAVAVRRIVGQLVGSGCREIPWGESVAVGEPGQLEVEARRALSGALTQRGATILLDQYRGALRHEVESLLAMVERVQAGDSNAALTARLERLLLHGRVGLHLVQPWRVVLAGPANVGKSSLINALLGYERSIVFGEPGTTRDVLAAVTALEGWGVELTDTAGWRDADDPVERAGQAHAREVLEAADLVVRIGDAREAGTDCAGDGEIRGPQILRVWNKRDLMPTDWRPPAGDVATSAITGEGVDELVESIVARLVPEVPMPGEAVPVTEGQVTTFETVAGNVLAGNLRGARERLQALL